MGRMGKRSVWGKKRLEKRKRLSLVKNAESDKVMEASTERFEKLIPTHGSYQGNKAEETETGLRGKSNTTDRWQTSNWHSTQAELYHRDIKQMESDKGRDER